MINPVPVWRRFFGETIWQPDPQGRLAPWVYKSLQILILAFKDLLSKGALLRTSALGYASVLAIIPMLALLFAIFKGFGLQRLLAAHLLPQLAGGSQDFARQIISYVETTNVASLGVFGVIWLLVALMILMTNIEQAFNHIWKISRSRPWWRKLSDYLSIFLLFPILMAVAISLYHRIAESSRNPKDSQIFYPGDFFLSLQPADFHWYHLAGLQLYLSGDAQYPGPCSFGRDRRASSGVLSGRRRNGFFNGFNPPPPITTPFTGPCIRSFFWLSGCSGVG